MRKGLAKPIPLPRLKDSWANLFEYKGSHENVRLKFAIDKIGATLDDIAIIYEDSSNGEAWEKFISSLKEKKPEPDKRVSEEAEVAVPPLERRTTLLPRQVSLGGPDGRDRGRSGSDHISDLENLFKA